MDGVTVVAVTLTIHQGPVTTVGGRPSASMPVVLKQAGVSVRGLVLTQLPGPPLELLIL